MNAISGLAAHGRQAQAYAKVGLESGVMSASPHQLIVMLFDGAQMAIRAAGLHMANDNMSEKGRAISKALDIVNHGLLASLDQDKGGEVAASLASLYDYVGWLLLQANLKNDQSKLDAASSLLEDIGSAWREIGQSRQGE